MCICHAGVKSTSKPGQPGAHTPVVATPTPYVLRTREVITGTPGCDTQQGGSSGKLGSSPVYKIRPSSNLPATAPTAALTHSSQEGTVQHSQSTGTGATAPARTPSVPTSGVSLVTPEVEVVLPAFLRHKQRYDATPTTAPQQSLTRQAHEMVTPSASGTSMVSPPAVHVTHLTAAANSGAAVAREHKVADQQMKPPKCTIMPGPAVHPPVSSAMKKPTHAAVKAGQRSMSRPHKIQGNMERDNLDLACDMLSPTSRLDGLAAAAAEASSTGGGFGSPVASAKQYLHSKGSLHQENSRLMGSAVQQPTTCYLPAVGGARSPDSAEVARSADLLLAAAQVEACAATAADGSLGHISATDPSLAIYDETDHLEEHTNELSGNTVMMHRDKTCAGVHQQKDAEQLKGQNPPPISSPWYTNNNPSEDRTQNQLLHEAAASPVVAARHDRQAAKAAGARLVMSACNRPGVAASTMQTPVRAAMAAAADVGSDDRPTINLTSPLAAIQLLPSRSASPSPLSTAPVQGTTSTSNLKLDSPFPSLPPTREAPSNPSPPALTVKEPARASMIHTTPSPSAHRMTTATAGHGSKASAAVPTINLSPRSHVQVVTKGRPSSSGAAADVRIPHVSGLTPQSVAVSTFKTPTPVSTERIPHVPPKQPAPLKHVTAQVQTGTLRRAGAMGAGETHSASGHPGGARPVSPYHPGLTMSPGSAVQLLGRPPIGPASGVKPSGGVSTMMSGPATSSASATQPLRQRHPHIPFALQSRVLSSPSMSASLTTTADKQLTMITENYCVTLDQVADAGLKQFDADVNKGIAVVDDKDQMLSAAASGGDLSKHGAADDAASVVLSDGADCSTADAVGNAAVSQAAGSSAATGCAPAITPPQFMINSSRPMFLGNGALLQFGHLPMQYGAVPNLRLTPGGQYPYYPTLLQWGVSPQMMGMPQLKYAGPATWSQPMMMLAPAGLRPGQGHAQLPATPSQLTQATGVSEDKTMQKVPAAVWCLTAVRSLTLPCGLDSI